MAIVKKKIKAVGSRIQVMNGTALRTPGGLLKKNLKRVTKGSKSRIRSLKKHTSSKRNLWMDAVAQGKRELNIKKNELVLLNQGQLGKDLYNVAKKHHMRLKRAASTRSTRSTKKKSSSARRA